MRQRLLPIALILLCLWLFPIRRTPCPASDNPLSLVPEESITLYAGQSQSVSLESYVSGAVTAEMPSGWPMEALKAQAVAARTYALHHARAHGGSGCLSHPDCDLCDDPACCQAWSAQADRRAVQAASETRGEVLTYEGRTILALYHAASGGQTEDVEAVFSQPLPYLRSVSSPGEDTRYADSKVFTLNQLEKLSGQTLSEPLSDCLSVLSRTASGRIEKIRLGEATLSGREFRALLSLPSSLLTLSFESDDAVRIDSAGYGHGVGMSQAGAQAMAENGADYRDILRHYYTGCVIKRG